MVVHVEADEFAARVRALLRMRGQSRPWPRRRLDRWVLLQCIARRVGPGEELNERQANERIQNWLLGPGAHLDVDFVTVRRALIDEGFWDREAGGTRYRRSRVHGHRVTFANELPGEENVLAESRPKPGRRPEGS
jgi:hypothetical protein